MEIKLNAQSSIKITTDKIIYFDPYLIKEESHDADYILITHEHYDHFDKFLSFGFGRIKLKKLSLGILSSLELIFFVLLSFE